MRIFINPRQASHHPRDEIFRGNRVPCFETPSRAMFVEQALRARGHVLHAPDVDSAVVLGKVRTGQAEGKGCSSALAAPSASH